MERLNVEKIKRRQRVITISLLVIYLLALTWIILFKMALSSYELPYMRNINTQLSQPKLGRYTLI